MSKCISYIATKFCSKSYQSIFFTQKHLPHLQDITHLHNAQFCKYGSTSSMVTIVRAKSPTWEIGHFCRPWELGLINFTDLHGLKEFSFTLAMNKLSNDTSFSPGKARQVSDFFDQDDSIIGFSGSWKWHSRLRLWDKCVCR